MYMEIHIQNQNSLEKRGPLPNAGGMWDKKV